MQLITLDGIDKAYPETDVLSGVSLSISDGQRIGLIGQNGSGKSTLLGIIDGTVEPDAGEIIRASGLGSLPSIRIPSTRRMRRSTMSSRSIGKPSRLPTGSA